MCGITGFFKNSSLDKKEAKDQIYLMNNELIHRGPDDCGYWIDEKRGIALAHTRLSIIDLSKAGSQPMLSISGRYVISFNGEVYNFQSIRKKLNNSGHNINWKGNSDTEILINAIEIWGIVKTLNEIIGMFAFALFDTYKNELTIARDRIGEKPIYYGIKSDNFIFSSEIKALRKFKYFSNELDYEGINLFLKYGFIPSPYSIYKDIKKLTPGCIVKIKVNKQNLFTEEKISYWSLEEINKKNNKSPFQGNFEEASLKLEDILENTIREQMTTDVQTGCFLSGGIDSSLVSSLMQKNSSTSIKTFSIGFDDKLFDESIYARKVSKIIGSEHTELYINDKDALDLVPEINKIYDEPFADSSQIPTILLSRLTRNHVKVALSGDGGDEIFGGYNRYYWYDDIYKYSKFFSKNFRLNISEKFDFIESKKAFMIINSIKTKFKIKELNKILNSLIRGKDILKYKNKDDLYERIFSINYDANKFIKNSKFEYKYLKDSFKFFNSDIKRIMAMDTLIYLPDDILVKVDRASMSVGLETRVPLLDKRVIEFASKLPLEMKYSQNNKKAILKSILKNYLPHSLINRPKKGFSIPLSEWLRGSLRNWCDDLLSLESLNKYPYLNAELIKELYEEHISGKKNNKAILWNFLILISWLEENK